jgi:hypothetical protein
MESKEAKKNQTDTQGAQSHKESYGTRTMTRPGHTVTGKSKNRDQAKNRKKKHHKKSLISFSRK